MELSGKLNFKNTDKNKKEFYRYIIFIGLLLAIGIALLKTLDFFFISYSITSESYIGLISAAFLALGLYLGIKLTKEKREKIPKPESIALPENIELSSREVEVLENIALGLSNQEIADKLFVSLNTVKTHTANIYSKLNVKRRIQAAEIARKLKIIP